jgi:hypothetical protein
MVQNTSLTQCIVQQRAADLMSQADEYRLGRQARRHSDGIVTVFTGPGQAFFSLRHHKRRPSARQQRSPSRPSRKSPTKSPAHESGGIR